MVANVDNGGGDQIAAMVFPCSALNALKSEWPLRSRVKDGWSLLPTHLLGTVKKKINNPKKMKQKHSWLYSLSHGNVRYKLWYGSDRFREEFLHQKGFS